MIIPELQTNISNYLNMWNRIITGIRNNNSIIRRNNSLFWCNAVKKIVNMTTTIYRRINMLMWFEISAAKKQILHDAQMGCIGGLITGYIIIHYK
ncbi:hypothetical protein PGAG_00306 [Phaeocystis globosa virus 12T]|uniref:Uncharacterized protein n=1 Tax=Phaeocystis globosa virus PgV-16T TaxID=3071227 RepID=A0AC59EXC3_9VIRU|nr:hypothetical protein PGCG_00345 [Phaeocystis globosa virus]AET73195.1 hypothetical protein PGAG_00306 [Phaeocystis globosa virus 12T]AET74019.1 hypothetical protein PGBG_00311 [Phaeocystis globosa virus 14T]AGM15656.1 hypothetical protein PGCG_00345 [Phaeocystis globosa virus PgV-16T]UYE94386.1 hypothetical protein PGV14T_00345 [Phaeocystis globosa virus]